jgi:hypothetical protein
MVEDVELHHMTTVASCARNVNDLHPTVLRNPPPVPSSTCRCDVKHYAGVTSRFSLLNPLSYRENRCNSTSKVLLFNVWRVETNGLWENIGIWCKLGSVKKEDATQRAILWFKLGELREMWGYHGADLQHSGLLGCCRLSAVWRGRGHCLHLRGSKSLEVPPKRSELRYYLIQNQ